MKEEHYIDDLEGEEGFEDAVEESKHQNNIVGEAIEELRISERLFENFINGDISIETADEALDNMRRFKGRLAVDEL